MKIFQQVAMSAIHLQRPDYSFLAFCEESKKIGVEYPDPTARCGTGVARSQRDVDARRRGNSERYGISVDDVQYLEGRDYLS